MSSDSDDLQNHTTTLTSAMVSTEALPIVDFDRNEIYLSAITFFSLLSVLSNGIVMMVVVFCRDLHLPTLWNIAFMASCDFLYSLHYMVFTVPSLYMGQFAYSDSMITLASITMTMLFGQNIFNIFLSIVDRYIAICWPLRYHCLMSAKRFSLAVLSLFAVNIIRLCLIILPKSAIYYNMEFGICLVNFNTTMSAAASVGLPFLTAVLIVVLLIKIGMEFRCRKKVHPNLPNTQTNRFTATMCLAAAIFILSYLPTCGSIVMNVAVGRAKVNVVYTQTSLVFLLSNSVWNVVIYATTYRPFRHGFLRLFCRKVFRDRARREANVKIAYCSRTYSDYTQQKSSGSP